MPSFWGVICAHSVWPDSLPYARHENHSLELKIKVIRLFKVISNITNFNRQNTTVGSCLSKVTHFSYSTIHIYLAPHSHFGWLHWNFAKIVSVGKIRVSWLLSSLRCLHNDTFIGFGRTPACDWRTDRQDYIAYTALAYSHHLARQFSGSYGHFPPLVSLHLYTHCLLLLQPFYGPLPGTTRVSRYQKKHSLTPILIIAFLYQLPSPATIHSLLPVQFLRV